MINNKFFILALMAGTLSSTNIWADTAEQNCLKTVGSDNCKTFTKNDEPVYYSVNDGTMTIYGSTDEDERTVVPEQAFRARWLPERATALNFSGNVDIGQQAFHETYGLTSVDLRGVHIIEDNAFCASGLTNVNFEGVQVIKNGAFWYNLGLTNIDLTGVQSVVGGAFHYTRLNSIFLSESLFNSDGSIKQLNPYNACGDNSCSGIPTTAFLGGSLKTIYCPEGKTCDANFFTGIDTPTVVYYTKDPATGIITLDNAKSFASTADLLSGKSIPKRIYTVEEASKAAKPQGNTFSIRYR